MLIELRKKSDVRNVTIRFPDGQEKTYSVGSTANKDDVLAWAKKVYPEGEILSVKVGIIVKGRLNWDWEVE